MRRLALAVLSALLISCAMGPDYTRPGVSTPESFRMAGKEGESIANLPWWKLLRDEELQKLVRIALNENKDLKQAVASVEEFQARLYIARTDFAPQLSVTGNAPVAKMGGVGFPGFPSSFSYYGQGSLSWEVDFWGRVAGRMKRHARTSSPGRKTDVPSFCNSCPAWPNPISIFASWICNWTSPSAPSSHGRSRCGSPRPACGRA